MRKKYLAIPLLTVLATSFALAQGENTQSYLLRKDLKENQSTEYKLEFNMSQLISSEALGGEQEFGILGSLKYNEKTGKYDVEKKLLDQDVVISNMKFEFTGMAVMMQGMMDQLPREFKTNMKVDNRNQITPAKPDPKAAQMNLILNMVGSSWTQALVLPELAVKVGDVWDTVLPKSANYGNKEVKLKSKLTGLKTIDTVNAAVIVTEGILPLTVDLSEMMGSYSGGGEGTASLSGPLLFKMESLVDVVTGKVIEVSVTTSGKQLLEFNQMTMDVKNKTTLKLKPWKAAETTPPTKN